LGTSVAPLRVWHVRTRSIAPDSIFQRAQDDSDSQISDAPVLNVRPRPAARSARAVGEPGVMAHPKTGLSSVLLGRCCLGSSGRDGESDRCDLGCPKTEIFFEMGLDWWNQIDPVQQIRPCAQLRDLVVCCSRSDCDRQRAKDNRVLRHEAPEERLSAPFPAAFPSLPNSDS
jgi:hypothetical protein